MPRLYRNNQFVPDSGVLAATGRVGRKVSTDINNSLRINSADSGHVLTFSFSAIHQLNFTWVSNMMLLQLLHLKTRSHVGQKSGVRRALVHSLPLYLAFPCSSLSGYPELCSKSSHAWPRFCVHDWFGHLLHSHPHAEIYSNLLQLPCFWCRSFNLKQRVLEHLHRGSGMNFLLALANTVPFKSLIL